MVENVEELCPELRMQTFCKVPILSYRKIHVFETEVGEYISTHVSKLSKCRWDHDVVAFRVTTEQVQCSAGRPRGISRVQSQRLRVALRIVGRISLNVITGKVRNSRRRRLEIAWIPEEVPADGGVRRRADGQRTNTCCVGSLVHRPPELRTLQCDDGVELPSL